MRRRLCLALVASALVVAPTGPGAAPAGAQETPPPVIEVPPGGDIQAAADAAGPGAILQLQGSYTVTSTISPLDGQTFRGPATLVGQGVNFVFRNTGVGVTYEWLDISGATGTRASAIQLGVGGTIRNSVLHDNGWNGVRGQFRDGPANITLEDVELYGNGFDPAALGQGAGGYKFLNGDGLTTTRVYAHDNVGNGGWLDQHWKTFTSTDDVYVRNTRKGLFFEVSLGPALISNVTAQDNGQSGIQVNSSDDVVLTGAVLGGNAAGKGVVALDIYDQRNDEYKRHLSNVRFEASTYALNGDDVHGCELPGVICDPRVSVQVAGQGTGTVTSSPAGIACASTCSAWFPLGASVTLDAVADPGSEFVGWEGACTGTGPCELAPTGPVDVTATFRALEPLSVTLVEDGRTGVVTSTPEGIDCGPTCSATFPRGTQVELVATPEPDAAVEWQGCAASGSDPNRCTVTLDAPVAVTATFRPAPHALSVTTTGAGTVTSEPAGIDCGSVCEASYPSGTAVALTASPGTGHTFGGWGGDCSGTAECTVMMDGARSVSATFDPIPRRLTVTTDGAGTVESTPAGIDCGATCDASFPHGTQVTLTATPEPGSVFVGWTGACSGADPCVVTLDADLQATATFVPGPRALDVTVVGSGRVTSSPAGIDCGVLCIASFPHGTEVALAATPGTGQSFTGWGGACSGTGACTVTMDEARSVTATFSPLPRQLSVATVGTGSVTSSPAGIDCGATCSATYDHGTVVTLTATAGQGQAFAGWSGACSGTGTCQVTMDADRSATATFVAAPTTTTLGDGDASVRYQGWSGVVDPGASGGTYRVSSTKNEVATWVSPSVTSITWVARTGPDRGKASVTIDGVGKGTFDLYAGSPGSVSIPFNNLGGGAHTVTIKVLGSKRAASSGTSVTIDAFVAGGVTTQDPSALIAYASWSGVSEPAATDGAARRSATKNATATVTFTGTRIDWITAFGRGYGKANVTIDGTNLGTFDLYASADAWQQPLTFANLSAGTHTMTIKVLGQKRAVATGTAVVVDGFVVHP